MSFRDKIPDIFRYMTDAGLHYGVPSGTSNNLLYVHCIQATSVVREYLVCVLVSDVMTKQ